MLQSFLIALLVIVLTDCCRASSGERQARATALDWPAIGPQQRPWTRWWWPGNAVDRSNLTRELERMRDVGIGGVEITPIYGVNGCEDRQIAFLSPSWVEMLEHVGQEGKRLHLGVDMATCTGWPFGGPMVEREDATLVVTLASDGALAAKPSGMKVKRAAPGGEGLVLNPFSLRAIDRYLQPFDRALKPLAPGLLRAQFHDSFEYSGNWSDELLERFRSMHGYDLRNQAPALFGQGEADHVARVKSDYRATLAAAHLAYIEAWVNWCHSHGWRARNQAHGAPGNLLDLYGAADIPETETFGSTQFNIPGFRRDPADVEANGPNPIVTQFASSAAHVMGRPLASCETLTWLREHFRVSPAMCKPEIDQMFLAGVNHIIYHGTCFSPDDAAWPGWLFYASSEVNPRDTIWHNLSAMNDYVARCQSILQSGSADNDVLVYFPVFDHWASADGMQVEFKMHLAPKWLAGTEIEKTARELTERGYAYDFISDKQLIEHTNVEAGKLCTPGGRYRVLLVPPTQKMPLETMEKIVALAEAGATVLVQGPIPSDVPGLGQLEDRREAMARLLGRTGLDQRATYTPSGSITRGSSLAGLLTDAGVPCESFVQAGIGFIRRTHPSGHHYFIAALGSRGVDGWVPLAAAFESAALMDPLTGRVGVAATRRDAHGRAEVYLQLSPGESIIVRTFSSSTPMGQAWRYAAAAGESIEVTGSWQVDFIEGGPDLPGPAATGTLASWTMFGDEKAQRFAGTAVYRIRFDNPPAPAGGWLLDLGDVRESARVKVNGKEIGTAWSLPFRLALDEPLREEGNLLEIAVTNLAANRLRELDRRGVKWRIFKEINYVNIHYKPFDASDWPLADSGLLGPVRLVPVRWTTEP